MAKVKGKNYVEADEAYDKKSLKKDAKILKTAGLATALKKSEKEMGYSKKPKVKPQPKLGKIVLKKGKVI